MNGDERRAIDDLISDYAEFIDSDRLEDWLDFFVEDCIYKIIPKENVDQGLPLTLMLCENKNMLRDRIASLREANIYNIHTDRHIVSGIRVHGKTNGAYDVTANYAVFQTNQEGATRVFSVGVYHDKIVFDGGVPKFKEKVVIVDTAAIPTLLSTPL